MIAKGTPNTNFALKERPNGEESAAKQSRKEETQATEKARPAAGFVHPAAAASEASLAGGW